MNRPSIVFLSPEPEDNTVTNTSLFGLVGKHKSACACIRIRSRL